MFIEKLEKMQMRYQELAKLLSDPKTMNDQKKYVEFTKEYSDLKEVVEIYHEFKKVKSDLQESEKLLEDKDTELQALAYAEVSQLREKIEELEKKIKVALVPKDPMDEKNVIIEIRAGTGGEEAALFAGDLFRMYSKYAEIKGWNVEILSSALSSKNGFKEVIALVSGKNVYGDLKYESGVHRVQRVPETEAQGRIHTSASTVAILPEADEIDVKIDAKDLQIDTFRSSGPGGQSVNKTDSAVRITHIPTGLVVACQDEKSQHKNKAKALKVLRARLLEKEESERQAKIDKTRKSQVGTGDRSERIRTYNFPQNRITDHRIGLTLKKLDIVMQGKLGEIVEALKLAKQTERMKE